jgi:hypothetical protein
MFPCKASEQSAPGKFSSALVVVSGATDVNFSKYHGTDQVAYKLRSDFPATGVIEEIKAEMAKQGWQPLKEDSLNPGIPSSMVSGWSEFSDATKHPIMTVHQWITDWNNNKGEIVRYSLRYQYPEGKDKDLKNLKVNAIYTPASLVKKVQKAISDYRSKNRN